MDAAKCSEADICRPACKYMYTMTFRAILV